jgi:hypothetical protein
LSPVAVSISGFCHTANHATDYGAANHAAASTNESANEPTSDRTAENTGFRLTVLGRCHQQTSGKGYCSHQTNAFFRRRTNPESSHFTFSPSFHSSTD